MRILIVILELILAFMSCSPSHSGIRSEVVQHDGNEEIFESIRGIEALGDAAVSRPAFSTSGRAVLFTGGNILPAAPQTPQTRRRTSTGRSFFIRDGKVIDANNFTPFFSVVFLKESGCLSCERYIFSICFLRL
ncbi:MAG: hypothetical protein PUK70_08960 [Bacteroidales bacterium]|nr:hypothetical protein [Bacteroidales bacterium]MDY6002133.1 hypothetical protein [Candidatus Cryptobacteroides sp.]